MAKVAQQGKEVFGIELSGDDQIFHIGRTYKNFKLNPFMLKAMKDSLKLINETAIENVHKMKVELSGWLRNSFKHSIVQNDWDKITGTIWNDAWYAYMVHEGLDVHAIGGKNWIDPKGQTPLDVQQKQLKALKLKKERIKGERPFLRYARIAKENEIHGLWDKAVNKYWNAANRKGKKLNNASVAEAVR